jgi:hypothetical protein
VAVTPTTSFSDNNVPFTLSTGDGTKTVYAWYKDAPGNVSSPASDTIILDQTAPAAVTDLTFSNVAYTSLDLKWTAPGDDGTSGQAISYEVRTSTSSITLSSWNTATPVTGLPTPKPAGGKETFTVSGLTAKTTYYFALRTLDEVGNISSLSNVRKATTKAQPPSK